MTERGRRRYELDLLRLLAAAAVVAFHLTYGNHVLGFNPVGYPGAVQAVSKYGFLGVQVFFFISGLVILNSASSGSAKRFAISRIVRLYPAYWACVTASFLVINLAGARHIPLSEYVVNMTMLEGFVVQPLIDAVYWTLQVELIFYGIVWLVLLAGQMKRMPAVLWAWLGVASLTTLAQMSGHTIPNRIIVATGYAAYFVVGAAFALYLRGDRGRSMDALLWCSGVLSLFRAYFDAKATRVMYPAVNVWLSVAIVGVSMLVVLVVASGRVARFGRPWMVTAGLLTYPLYLIHDEVSNVLYAHLHAWNRWLLLTLVTAVVVLAAAAVHVAIEKPLAPRLKAMLQTGWGKVVPRRPVAEPLPASGPPRG